MDKTGIARLLRCSWEAVDAIVTRVVVDHIDDARLDQLYRIGVDEISDKRGHKFLTIVADHDTGNVVWVGKERSKAAFEEFFAALGPRTLGRGRGDQPRRQQRLSTRHPRADPASADPPRPVQRDQVDQRSRRIGLPRRSTHHALWPRHARAPRLAPRPFRRTRRPREPRRPTPPDPAPAPASPIPALAHLGTQRTATRPLAHHGSGRRPRVPQTLVHRRETQPDPRLPQPGTPDRETLRGNHRRRRTRPVELPPRRRRRQLRLIQRRGYGFRNLNAPSAAIYLCLGGVTIQLSTET
jgi:transposase